MALRERGEPEPESAGFSVFGSKGKSPELPGLNFSGNVVNNKGGVMSFGTEGELPPEVQEILTTVKEAIGLLIIAYDRFTAEPNNKKYAQEYLAMVKDVVSIQPMCIAILGVGISAMSELAKRMGDN
jgi:hypothetical protein